MKKFIVFLSIGLLGANNVIAQTTDSSPEPSKQKTELTSSSPAGFSVTEIRQQQRLDQVIIDHKSTGVRDYYNFNDPTTSLEDDSLGSRRVMRTWQFGNKTK